MPPRPSTGVSAIAMPCIVAPSFLTAKVTSPALTEGLSDLTHMSPSVTLTSAGPAASAAVAPPVAAGSAPWPPPAFGAFGVASTPSAPLTMSPKACVTNG